ncbi:gp436 family protein [Vibrio harveyi]|uniref:DUF1320 domain-containing protein n=1 Tax=Vibrio harveyi TaxID=669 RepID=A0ABN4L9U9_VIBHA|nr:DUF1320 domain-containing protein [Vibrio harveyi]AMG01351.1 DUF1320 domain-containing protein [Vibrio harveyi]ELY1986520.1 DUF1320 domain-containing protein [Vibrio harveyi]
MYCTADDMIKRFERSELEQLTDKDGSNGDIVDPVLTQAIEDATSMINSYLSGVVRLPLSNPPENLNRLCADIARYFLYDDVLDDAHQAARRYKAAMDYLKLVASGKIRLDMPPEDANASATNLVEFGSAGSVFARDKSKGFL